MGFKPRSRVSYRYRTELAPPQFTSTSRFVMLSATKHLGHSARSFADAQDDTEVPIRLSSPDMLLQSIDGAGATPSPQKVLHKIHIAACLVETQ